MLATAYECYGDSSHFLWKTSNRLNDRNNWLHSTVPCDGDYVRFGANTTVVTILEGKMRVDAMELPTSGIIFLDNAQGGFSVLGEKGSSWQCNKRGSREGWP